MKKIFHMIISQRRTNLIGHFHRQTPGTVLTTKEIPASVGTKLLDLNRTSIYYKGTLTSDEELACKEIIDHLHTDNPAWGARQMSA
ncbi:MAG: hypothetical protein UEU90_05670 [Lachnospiraceae bacterium]|nr:hypothetical protein [Lachnospiraceae bacterium]